MNKLLVINTEFFLQCGGHCAGCFLTNQERQSSQIFEEEVLSGLKKIAEKNNDVEQLIIGVGRGNNLILTDDNLLKIKNVIDFVENNYKYKEITYEISTSLIGKIDSQIEKAKKIINFHPRVFFNIVVNSEIVAKQFWKNVEQFLNELSNYRKNKFNLNDNYGDILVLNVNPENLPDIDLIREYTKNLNSPVNISFFPFLSDKVNQESINKVKNWENEINNILKNKDFNIKNFLENLSVYNYEDVVNHHKNSLSAYYFVDKHGDVTKGIHSIMGEVDFPRLKDKFKITHDFELAWKEMQKNKTCNQCDYQAKCLASGAYINFMINKNKINEECPSLYKYFFEKYGN